MRVVYFADDRATKHEEAADLRDMQSLALRNPRLQCDGAGGILRLLQPKACWSDVPPASPASEMSHGNDQDSTKSKLSRRFTS